MTSRRDDTTRAMVAPLLNELRGELLVMPSEQVVEDHIEMMAFEQQILSTPRLVRRTRSTLVRPRRTAFVVACVCTTVVSCGLSAAGALPEPLQHITESIARTLGVPQPNQLPPAPHVSGGALPSRPAPTSPPAVTPTAPTAKAAAAPTQHVASGGPPAVVPSKPKSNGGPQPLPFQPPRPTTPGKRHVVTKHHKPPSRNSDNRPPGYPVGWRDRAIDAATAHLQSCSQAQALTQVGCPQDATAVGENAQAQSVQWTLLNDPAVGAVVVAQTKYAANHTSPSTKVTVYERFRMDASYTEAGDTTHTYLAYSGGIAQATMTWNGSAFEKVSFSTGSVAGHLLPGVTVSPLPRPAAATDASVLGVVQAGFNDCTTIKAPAADAIPNCAPDAVAAQWTLAGDPTAGAVVTFDQRQGSFTVTGAYAMTTVDATGASVTTSGHYTATLFFDGTQLQLLAISAGP